jgi:hypothetical protein
MFRLWLGAITGELTRDHAKTTIAHRPEVRLRALRIGVPSMAEQKRIVTLPNDGMAQVERLQRHVDAQLQAVEVVPSALLRQAFTGGL